ncbi:fibronectin type III domain-containing protein [Candidatus Poriferisodalis sp.]|uniref:fibronectin type III domain-containing protein n=1 Tax=Candidatus Poriferisodalis sp. TaxID=3101277 RepID=UPI003B0169CD
MPGAPAGLSARAAVTALNVSWQPPADVGANAIDGYDVQYKTTAAADQTAATAGDPSTGWVDAGHSGTATAATVSGLANGTSYDVRVRATNGVAPGGAWATASGTPSSPPIWITEAVAGGPGELVVKWSRGPGVDTGYHWRWRVKSPQGPWLPSAQGEGSFRTRGVTLTGLAEGETYEVQVNGVAWRSIGSPTPWSPIAQGTAGEAAEPKTFSVTSAVTAAEGEEAELSITLSEAAPTGGVEFDVTVTYGSDADGADSGDVTPPGATVTVGSGETSATVSIPIARDTGEEDDETFTVAFAPAGTGASEWAESSVGAGTATVTITDTTETVRFKRTKVKMDETRDGPNHTVRITRTGDVTRPVEVTLTFTSGTAASPDDYRAYEGSRRTVTIAGGKRHRDVLMPIVNDKVAEDTETFTVTLTTSTSGYAVGDSLVVKIVDDDIAGVVVRQTALTVDEKETVTYKLKLATKPTHNVTITATSSDPEQALLGREPAKTRTFTPENWNKAQTLTVRAKPVGDAGVTISHTAVSDDPSYDRIAIDPVAVTIANVLDLPDAVNNLQFSVEGTSVTVTWTAPDTPDQVSRYYVKVMPADGSAVEANERLRRPQAAGEQMSETFGNLVPGATYKISVRAVGTETSDKGERTWTEEFTVPPAA